MDREDLPAAEGAGLQSLNAALLLLAALARREGATGLSDLARDCGMPASKAHRYLASFQQAGLVQQKGRAGKYDLGPAAIEIGLAALNRHDFVTALAEDLPSLTEETGLTALLCVWGGQGPVVIRWERTTAFLVTALGLGTTMPLLSSATGRVFLAWLPEPVTAPQRDRELARAGAAAARLGLPSTRAEVLHLAAQVRAAGHAAVDGRFIPGLVAVSAPVLDWQDQAQAAVTLIGTDPALIAPESPAIRALSRFCAGHSIPQPGPKPGR